MLNTNRLFSEIVKKNVFILIIWNMINKQERPYFNIFRKSSDS